MTDLAKLTWPEARARFGPDPVCILPIGATEPHGPHLPLDTDVTIANAQAGRAAELRAAKGVDAIVLPTVAYGLMKANLDRSIRADLDTCLAHEAEGTLASASTADHREAVRAFIEKRTPDFEGR